MKNFYYIHRLLRDLLIVVGSIIVAIVLVKAGLIDIFIEATSGSKILSSFIAGAFFTSIFTLAPAAVGLIAIGGSFPPVLVAFFAAFGAMLVDLIIVSFIRKDISEDLNGLAQLTLRRYFIEAFHFGFLKWVALVLGMFFIVTPLPDEAGLFLIGVSKVKTSALPVILYLAHFFGIYILVSVAQAI